MRHSRNLCLSFCLLIFSAGTAPAALNTTPVLTLEGTIDFGELGASVATAGDVNGDGYSDILVGEPRFASILGSNTGRARLYLGGPDGPDDVADWTGEGSVSGSQFGYCVAPAGDVNGDSYDDVLVGAPSFTSGQSGEGVAYLYYGSASGLSALPAWSYQSNDVGARLGFSVATAGDVNGDTYDDIVIGAPYFTNTLADQGSVFIFHGRPTVPLATPTRTLDGFLPGDGFGYSVSTAGDLTGDGYSDILVGAPFQNIIFGSADAGAAYAFHGGATGVDATIDWLVLGTQLNEYFGSCVTPAGDVDGDGYSDVLVSSVGFDNAPASDNGRVFGFLGAAGGLATTPARTYTGAGGGHQLGLCVATGGDINGDGYADQLIGAPNFVSGQADEGAFYAYYGGTVGFPGSAFATSQMNVAGSRLGFSLQTAGDVDGDGFSDVIVSAPSYDGPGTNRGRVMVYRGDVDYPTSASITFSAESNQASASLGFAAAFADVNGDGYSDLLAGSPLWNGAVVDGGRAQCWLGGPGGVANPAAWSVESLETDSRFGWSVAGVGDVNGDGYEEVLVGAPKSDAPLVDQGSVSLYAGSATGLSGSAMWSSSGLEAGSEFGTSVAAAGDFNADGYADFVVGMPRRTNPQPREGAAVIFLGSASGNATFIASWEGNQDDALAGTSVAGAGDINGDGYSDIIVGAPYYDNGEADEGMVFVFLGSAPPYAGGPSQFIERNLPGAHFGQCVAPAGDVNGDGYSDIIVGAPGWSNGQAGEGSVAVYLGSPAGLGTSPAFSYESNVVSGALGSRVAPAGDLNKDGYSDILVGSSALAAGAGQALLFRGTIGSLSATPVWTETGSALAGLGSAVTGAGDVDGDGYPDYALGSSDYENGSFNEGNIRVYRGNRHATQGLETPEILPRQFNANGTANLALLGLTNSETTMQFGRHLRSPLGRCRVRFDWALEPLGNGFPVTNTSPQWYDSGAPVGGGIGSRVTFQGVASNLMPGTGYHWRGRTRSHSPFFPRTPWVSFSGNAALETDFRTQPNTSGVADGALPQAGLRVSVLRQAGSGTARLRFELPAAGRARLTLHDVSGRLVATLSDEDRFAGTHEVAWSGRSDQGARVAAGVYLARLSAGGAVARARLVVLH